MGRQSPDDGAEWATSLFTPSVVAIAAVHLVEAQYGEIWAGVVSVLLTVAIFGGVLMSLKYWHIPSTAGFLIAGLFLWTIIPDVTAEVVPWPFQVLQQVIIAVFFIIAILYLVNKLGGEFDLP
ncbi:hypothetical protein [Natronorubrum halophilum]|uniref:hypothetical protein n=1 Tax=Natronorubrum halophilum TaxID=1702106 RepID=UPI0010C1853E|nr:hypothetical protein [Natronorubrum halophilum]